MVADLKKGDHNALTKEERETVDAVLQAYGDKTSQWLSDLTHQEAPWLDARVGVPPGAFCENEILPADMAEFYGSLEPAK